ncbi:MAG: phosphorylase [Verrucomicrobiae bacterium]|nr:phosphorylase [Verrucomicrobiae bacterium]
MASDSFPPFEQGTLRESIRKRSASALASGALVPIDSEETLIEDHGATFPVRVATHWKRKSAASTANPNSPHANPFLPPDPALVVGGVSRTHLAVLNKFAVLPGHLLIVTHIFEPQGTRLNAADFAAWGRCLAEFSSLGFYNSGPVAGASQSHRHLQLVPLPLSDQTASSFPIEPIVETGQIPFLEVRIPLVPDSPPDSPAWLSAADLAYRSGLESLGIQFSKVGEPTVPYNLLITPSWLWMIPRSRAEVDGISINGLGFAGSFFVKEASQIERLRSLGPVDLLRNVAIPLP